MPKGRPSTYTPELAAAICEEIASSERGLNAICESREDFPAPRTVYQWLEAHEDFAQIYARAKDRQADLLVEQTLGISDDAAYDWAERQQDGKASVLADHEHIQRSKLRVDTRKWAAARLAPRKYGDRAALELGGPGGGPIRVDHGAHERLGRALDALAKRLGGE